MTAAAKKHKQLVILHTNDTHSCIMPLSENLDNKDIAKGRSTRICCSSTQAISVRDQAISPSSREK